MTSFHTNQNLRSTAKKRGIFIFILLITLIPTSIFVGLFLNSILSLEHYYRVYEHPLTVTAVVTKHDSYDDDGDTDFRSYISYSANGTQYANISFEDEETVSDLTPIGQQVQVDVSPENPAKLLSRLKNDGRGLIVTASVLVLLISVVLGLLILGKRTKGICGSPSHDIITQDLLLTIRGRFSRFLWPLACSVFLLMRWRYPAVFQNGVLVAATVCGALSIWCLYRDHRDIQLVNNQEFEMRWDTLVRKQYIPDSDGDTYRLHYQSDEKAWHRNVSHKHYDSVKEGSQVLAIYFPGKKKPILHYDLEGDAI